MSYFPNASFDLVGHSMGGVVAAYLAASITNTSDPLYPLLTRIHSITTLDSPVQGIPLPLVWLGKWFTLFTCGSSQSALDLDATSTFMSTVRTSATTQAIISTVRNSVDQVVPADIALLPGSWKDRVFTSSCDFPKNHSCVLHETGPAAVVQSIIGDECGGTAANATWEPRIVHVVTCALSVPTGVTLTIDPGTVVKFVPNASMDINGGSLSAQGTALAPIVFTSIKDDSWGGDTNNDFGLTSAAPGDWFYVRCRSGGALALGYTQLRFGGKDDPYGPPGELSNEGCSLNLTNSVLEHSGNAGLYGDGGTYPAFSGNTFQWNGGSAARLINLGTTLQPSGDTCGNSTENGFSLGGAFGNTTLGAADAAACPWIIAGQPTVPGGKTLIFSPGAVVKIEDYLQVNGSLSAQGTALAPIVFTSIKDDSWGGDTNNDFGLTSAAPGDWYYIRCRSGGALALAHTQLRFGGKNDPYGPPGELSSEGCSLNLTNSVLEHSGNAGLYISGSSGGHIGPSDPLVASAGGNIIRANGAEGIFIQSGTSDAIHSNSIYSNAGPGIRLGPGANNNQPAPVLTAASSDGGSTTVVGTLTAAPNTSYLVELFSDLTCGIASPQGRDPLGAFLVTTDMSGGVSFNQTIPLPITPTQVVTATATDPAGNTSPFSGCKTATSSRYCATRRADVDGDGVVSILDLANAAQDFTQSVPPAPVRFDQDGDGIISILDLTKMAQVFTQHVSACP